MQNEKTIKRNIEQTSQEIDNVEPEISRRQFSLGLSGILFSGTVSELPNRNMLPPQAGPGKLTSNAFNRPQHVLSDTTAGIWSPDSRHIATISESTVTLYNVSTGKSDVIYHKHTDEVLAVKWSADSQYLASSGFDHIVYVWEAISGQTMSMYKRHNDIVRDVVWSPNQRYIASAGYDKVIHVWEALTGKMVITCSGHDAEIQTLSWSPDGKYIMSTDLQNKAMIWRLI
ncbi:WD40 repeat domain-containing protein [Dictyobacter aurantiacus]|uniref:Uncharacterized protein n=1 Tax=Dictyobacter aurantiacus TaxID=1936993 RepID=A0A401Z886_9CHLR|nr:hypothetical protein [Dictyobacter aurantiacus]GCE03080.1 hypothetical protein KDAU_04090 [Dictyobacter aurantiacus]